MSYYMNVNAYSNEKDDIFIGQLQLILKVNDEIAGRIQGQIVEYVADHIPSGKVWIHGMIRDGNALIFQFSLSKNATKATNSFSFVFEDDTFHDTTEIVNHTSDPNLHDNANEMKREIVLKETKEKLEKIAGPNLTTYNSNKIVGFGNSVGKLLNIKINLHPKPKTSKRKKKKKSCKK
jgi:hypothetical protein